MICKEPIDHAECDLRRELVVKCSALASDGKLVLIAKINPVSGDEAETLLGQSAAPSPLFRGATPLQLGSKKPAGEALRLFRAGGGPCLRWLGPTGLARGGGWAQRQCAKEQGGMHRGEA